MLHHYNDITSRIDSPPKWYDENGVPRYCDFAPDQTADIYVDEAALVEIGCQNCGREFLVAFSRKRADLGRLMRNQPYVTLAADIRANRVHYGDPPNAGCCPSGPTMNCDDRRVIEYWRRDGFDWTRDPSLEISLDEPSTSEESC
jgi:hypothetical protein